MVTIIYKILYIQSVLSSLSIVPIINMYENNNTRTKDLFLNV
jgi:hypothetical protein